MVSELARCIESYYKRERNRLLFRNGMTLNSLATEMYLRLGERAIDTSVLSRCITGKRLFGPEHLEVFCDIMDSTREERVAIQQALSQDRKEREALRSKTPSYVYANLFEDNLACITQARINGYPRFAVELAEVSIRWVHAIARTVSTNERPDWHLLLAKVLVEKGIALREYLPPDEVAYASGRIAVKLQALSREQAHDELKGLADFSYGDAWFVAGTTFRKKAYEKSAYYLERALLNIKDPDYRIWAMRGLLLDYAYLGKQDAFSMIVAQIDRLIKDEEYTQHNLAFAALEGITRGYCLLDSWEEAHLRMEQVEALAKELGDKGQELGVFRKIQLVRTRLEYLECFSTIAWTRAEEARAEGWVEETIKTARVHGYERHSIYMAELYRKLRTQLVAP